MSRIFGLANLMLLLAAFVGGCGSASVDDRTFENEDLSFTIPEGWQTSEEVWGDRAAAEQDYKGLGVAEVVSMQYPPVAGECRAFFVVASSPLAEGEDLESRFTQAYQEVVPAIEQISQGSFQQGGLSGYEITYKRPWGEPWWQFRDIWLASERTVYVLSFYASPDSFESYSAAADQILESLSF